MPWKSAAAASIGEPRGYLGAFSYFNDDPANIRNVAAFGGGGLMDIGCYLVMTSRLVFGEEPQSACALMRRDPASGVDTLTSLMLDYPAGQAVGLCSTRMAPHQRVVVMGTQARLEIEVPFNAPPAHPTRLWIDDGRDLHGGSRREIVLPACDQYPGTGRPILPGDSRRRGPTLPARGIDREHARDRRAHQIRQFGPLGGRRLRSSRRVSMGRANAAAWAWVLQWPTHGTSRSCRIGRPLPAT